MSIYVDSDLPQVGSLVILYLFRSLPKVLDESTQQTLLACARYAHPTARAFASTIKVLASLTLACGG